MLSTPKTLSHCRRPAYAALSCALLAASTLFASEVKILRVDTESDFRAGTFEGVSIGSDGALRLAERADRVAQLEEPFVYDAAPHPLGLVVGTGNAGRVLLVKEDGEVETLFELEEGSVYAVAADSDGYVYAGSSPDGRVVRFRDGNVETYFEPEQKYIWDLAVEANGGLLVATGTEGKLFRVDREGNGALVHDSKDVHIRSLLARPDGSALLGTAGEGLILELRGDSVRTLYDAAHPEVIGFAEGQGSVYAAVLASEASLVDLQPPPSSSSSNGNGEPSVKVEEGTTAAAAGSRRSGFKGSRSEVLQLSSSGAVDVVWRFEKETLFAIGWFRERLWVGSGMGGQLYSYRDRQMILEKDLEERQIVGLIDGDPGPVLLSTDAGAVYVFAGRTESEGTYVSKVFDAAEPARFGLLRWTADQPRGSRAQFAVRTGLSSEPDETWSDWQEAVGSTGEASLSDLPPGRYAQWKVDLSGDAPLVRGVELSYRQLNRRPEITQLEVLPPGEILVPANFNPSNQAYEPMSPNKDGIFTTLSPARDRNERSKSLFKLGYRTLRWTVTDPNKDSLRYRLELRRPGADWLELADELDAEHFSFDSSVLPDGRYEFRLVATDAESNVEAETLTAERVTEPVVVDQTPPEIVSIEKESDRWVVVVRDALSPLRRVELSVDAERWQAVATADGMIDGLTERLEIPLRTGGLITLRVADAAFNSRTIDLASVN
ncbi:MAG: hypothetical protein AAGA81_09545 [Acidobacteriota bacterium]